MTEYEELDTQLRAWLAEDRRLAQDAADCARPGYGDFDGADWEASEHGDGIHTGGRVIMVGAFGSLETGIGEHPSRHDPAAVLADITGKLALLDHVAGWAHEYVDGDTWFSCSQAESPNVSNDFAGPGSGCADEKRAGMPCDCGLDARRLAVLRCVAAGYVERVGFKDVWRLDGRAQDQGRLRVGHDVRQRDSGHA